MVTFELGLEVGIGVYVKREEKGILRRFSTKKKKKTGMDESMEWVLGKTHCQLC